MSFGGQAVHSDMGQVLSVKSRSNRGWRLVGKLGEECSGVR